MNFGVQFTSASLIVIDSILNPNVGIFSLFKKRVYDGVDINSSVQKYNRYELESSLRINLFIYTK